MTPREYWSLYVKENGGAKGVSAKLDLPYSTVAGICNGSRGIGRDVARRMKKKDPLLDESLLVLVASNQSESRAAA